MKHQTGNYLKALMIIALISLTIAVVVQRGLARDGVTATLPKEPVMVPTQTPVTLTTPLTAVAATGKAASTPIPSPSPTPSPTSTPTPTPPDAAARAMALLARDQDIPGSRISLLNFEAVDWPSPALECPQPGVLYTTIITPGWRFIMGYEAMVFEYHSDLTGTNILTCDEHKPPGPPTINLAAETGLSLTNEIQITRRSPNGEFKPIGQVDDDNHISQFVATLDLELILVPRSKCDPLGEIRFSLPSEVVTFGFFCGEPTIMRADQLLPDEYDLRIPEALGDLIGPYWSAAAGGLPSLPTLEDK